MDLLQISQPVLALDPDELLQSGSQWQRHLFLPMLGNALAYQLNAALCPGLGQCIAEQYLGLGVREELQENKHIAQ